MLLPCLELPDCVYAGEKPLLIRPNRPTPSCSLYLSDLDDQKFLRFFTKFIYVFKNSVSLETLKSSLSEVLVHYYPLAGRLRVVATNEDDDVVETNDDDHKKLEVDCNAQGAVFAEASADFTVEEFMRAYAGKPNASWRKLSYRDEAAPSFLDTPPLVIQVTKLSCGGMILCIAINHCLCDGVGTSQFFHAWAHLTSRPDRSIPVLPFHDRHVSKLTGELHPIPVSLPLGFTRRTNPSVEVEPTNCTWQHLRSQSPVVSSLTFTTSDFLRLKSHFAPSLKCTTFEALAAHTWRCWVKSLNFSPTSTVKLLFSVNVRNRVSPPLPNGFYGNGFVIGCAESTVQSLVTANVRHGVELLQHAKAAVTGEHVENMIRALEDKTVKPDGSMSLLISQSRRLGLEEVDFGAGKAAYIGPISSDVFCLFLPVIGDPDAVRVMVSLPEKVVEKFESFMKSHLA